MLHSSAIRDVVALYVDRNGPYPTLFVAVEVSAEGLLFTWGARSRLKLHSHPRVYRNVREGRRTVLKSFDCPRPQRPAIVEMP